MPSRLPVHRPRVRLTDVCTGWGDPIKPEGVEMGERQDREKRSRRWRDLRRSARNALALLRTGRLGAPYQAPFELVHACPTYRLRHYPAEERIIPEPLVLVPPLMLTAEVYDISPELSAVALLTRSGVDTWVVDFGAPEKEEGGLDRTLDDHVLAVADAVKRAAAATGQKVHLAGYSQGGMFAYQAAAWLRSEHLASVITFGSPVDIRKVIPVPLHEDLADRMLKAARSAVELPLSEVQGLPGFLTSTAFKVLSARKEVSQFLGLLADLPDREALLRREPKRRFLNGAGFVAWPGPALRQFLDDMVANNRLSRGGLVLGGRPVTLADLHVPVLAFVGARDELVRPAAVRSIHKAAPNAEVHEWWVPAGHFGLVVGSVALSTVWPGVLDWVAWQAGLSDAPEGMDNRKPSRRERDEDAEVSVYDQVGDTIDGLWRWLGDASLEMGQLLDTVRIELPRLSRLRSLGRDEVSMSLGRALREQAQHQGDAPFFLRGDRAWSWREVDQHVDRLVAVLVDRGAHAGEHIGLFFPNSSDLLAMVAACNRLGAVAVLLPAQARGESLRHALETAQVQRVVAAHGMLDRLIEVGTALPVHRFGTVASPCPKGVDDLEPALALDPPLPEGLALDAGQLGDVALLLFTSGTTGLPKAARITNRRWAMAALGAAAACRLTPSDTVYVTLPLQHATSLLLGVGGAVMGGARLSLGRRFSAQTFWTEVRRNGVTVVFYVGEMMRFLLQEAPSRNERHHPIRLFVGNGMRPDVWAGVLDRLGAVQVLEFYASTEGNVALANLKGERIGSVGRPLPGQPEPLLVAFDPVEETVLRDANGRAIPVAVGEPGLLLSEVRTDHPLSRFDGYTDPEHSASRVERDVVRPGDRWFNSGDLLVRDADGFYAFVDRLGDTFRFRGVNVSTEEVSSVLRGVPGVQDVVVYGVELPQVEGRVGMATIVLEEGATFPEEALLEAFQHHLVRAAWPRFVRIARRLPRTATFKAMRHALREQGADPRRTRQPIYALVDGGRRWERLRASGYDAVCAHLRGERPLGEKGS